MDKLSNYNITQIFSNLYYNEIISLRVLSKTFADFIITDQFWINLIKIRFVHLRNSKDYKTLNNEINPRLYYLELLGYKITINTDQKSYTFSVKNKNQIEPIFDALYSMIYILIKSPQDHGFFGRSPYISHTQPNLSIMVSREEINKIYSKEINQQIPDRNGSRLMFDKSSNLSQIEKPYILVYIHFRLNPPFIYQGAVSDILVCNTNVVFRPSNQKDVELFILTLQKFEFLPIYEIEGLKIKMYQNIIIDDKKCDLFRSFDIKNGIIFKNNAIIVYNSSSYKITNNDPLWNTPWYTKV